MRIRAYCTFICSVEAEDRYVHMRTCSRLHRRKGTTNGKLTPSSTWAAVLRDDIGGLAEDPIGGIAFVVNFLHTGAHVFGACGWLGV